jgi:hypothetical protein
MSGAEIPDGYYAVPDPRDVDTLTLWHVTADHIAPHPANARYGPVLHRRDIPAELSKTAAERWVRAWFEQVRLPWTEAVRAAITADPEAARALYAASAYAPNQPEGD